MMKIILKYNWFACCISILFLSCEKDNISNSYFDANPTRMDHVVDDLKKVLVSSENGWVMMVKSNLSADVYTPIVLKFDTVTNRVGITTVYGETHDSEDYFRISKGTGSPQLIFTTGSIMSTLYRVGAQASDITDHIYNVKRVSAEEIEIQTYRSGNVYKKEGGVVYTLFKRPDDWTWADSPITFDWRNPNFNKDVRDVTGQVTINHIIKNVSTKHELKLITSSDEKYFDFIFPFSVEANASTGGFKLFDGIGVTGSIILNREALVTLGHNALSIYPITAFDYQPINQNVAALTKILQTHYLIFKSQTRIGNNVKLEFEAYDAKGHVVIKAIYDNLK